MTQAGVVARLAVRELWISFRLLVVLVAFVGSGAVVALVPAPLPDTVARLAWGLGLAALVTAAAAAWSMAEERRAGRAAWLVSRSLSRGTLLAGWFVAMASVAGAALVAAATLGWLAATSVSLRLEMSGYLGVSAGVAASTLAASALGLLVGVIARSPRLAAAAAVALCALAGAAAWLAPVDPSLLPGGAHLALAALEEPGVSLGPGLRATGVGLASSGLLLGLARFALDRVEL